jgi:tetratricopeptide (TPR) repeat protein
MIRTNLLIISLLFLFSLNFALSTNKDKVEDLRKEAISLMNSGEFEESINILDSALIIEPNSIMLLYDKSLAYYKLEKYQEAIDILTPLKDRPDVFEQVYQILGNSYDFIAKKYTAIDIYNEGLRKFPNSGRLYMELGIAELGNENTNLALSYFERGIMAEPDFPNNYYHISKVLAEEKFNVQALIYAETFMNYVKNENKFREINKLIFDIYYELIFNSTDKVFNNKIRNNYNDFEKNYSEVLRTAASKIRENGNISLSLNDVNVLRHQVLELWYAKYPDSFNSKILSRQKKLSDEGLFEAYNYWLMSDADLDEFKKWIEQNYQDFDKLLLWLQNNRLIITSIIDLFPKV